jgi:hypothetical protein
MTNLAVPSVTFTRAPFSNQERVTVTAGITNKSADAAPKVPVTLEIDGHQVEALSVAVGANASTSVVFQPFTLAEPAVHGVVHAGTDEFIADNTFDFVLSPSQSVSVLIVDAGTAAAPSFFLARALSIGNAPHFKVETMPAARVTADTLTGRSVVVLNDTMLPPGLAGGVLKRFVERGGGLLVTMGEHTTWPTTETDLLPGSVGKIVDRDEARGGTIGFRDNSHPVFEVFKAPRSGDFSAARVLRYRAFETTPDARILARYDDGAVAAAEKRVGTGRVIALTTTLDDSWSDLALKPVYLPLVHQLTRYLSQYEETTAWQTVGAVVDLAAAYKGRADRVVVTPAAERRRFPAAEPGLLELTEHGVYEVRSASNTSGRPDRIAVNLDPAESDLTPLDPQELVAAVIGRATPLNAQREAATELTPEEAEKRQGLWWYLLVGGLLLLAAETVVANELSKRERFL